MHLTMVMLVRNELPILPYTIGYHSLMGVDRFIVMDHLSDDGTSELLLRMSAKYDIVVHRQESPMYLQSEWTTSMAREAYTLGTDWVIPCDADEFWLPSSGDLKDTLKTVMGFDAVRARWQQCVPVHGVEGPFYNQTLFRQDPIFTKTLFRSSPEALVDMGNHTALHATTVKGSEDSLRLVHYQYRDVEALYNKYVLGGQAIELSGFPSATGYHWKEGLNHYRNGSFAEFAKSHFSEEVVAGSDPSVYRESRMQSILKSLESSIEVYL